jgi:hypothetical protein
MSRPPYRGQFRLTRDETAFDLQPYSAMVKNLASCSLCRLVVSTVVSRQWSCADDPEWRKLDTTSATPVSCEIQEPKLEYLGYPKRGFFGTPSLSVFIHGPNTIPIQFQNVDKALSLTGVRQPRPDQIDVGPIEQWWRTCQARHGIECDNSQAGIELRELGVLRLIDVSEECVVTVPTDTPYAALSYRWGVTPIYTASKKEMVDGQLSLKDKPIPQTIRDAMKLVELMGEQYLWVDALSIIQDDPIDVERHVGLMDRIYKAAQFTIINASGEDANAGLEGLESGSRNLAPTRGTIEGVGLIEHPKLVMLGRSTWAQRAWTFQEYIFSRRKIIFAEGCVFYQCNVGISSEFFHDSIPRSKCDSSQLNPHALNVALLDPYATNIKRFELATVIPASVNPYGSIPSTATRSLEKYVRNVDIFSGRRASNQGDSLNAFQGVLSDLTSEYELKFCWGLPTSSFHMVLGWQIWASENRESANDIDDATLARYRADRYRWDPVLRDEQARTWFPSWSWASCDYPWKYSWRSGEFDCSKWESRIVSGWPWDPGYSLDRRIDPFTSGILQIKVDCATLNASALACHYNGVLGELPVVLDDMTLLSQESMKFARIADFRPDSVSGHAPPGNTPLVLIQVIGIEESAQKPGTYRRLCSLILPLSVWRSANVSREVINLT